MPRSAALRALRRREDRPPGHLTRRRISLGDGAETTVHVAEYDASRTLVRVVPLRGPAPLEAWCAKEGETEALVGGFYVRAPDGRPGLPLGELRTHGVRHRAVGFDAPWDAVRSCVSVVGGRARLAARSDLPAHPRGDLLQAGPMLVRGERRVVRSGCDPEGFSAGSRQFDSDITAGRHPRAALALAGERLLAIACDGRAHDEAGLTLVELADVLVDLGARTAINLDGGGSTSLVCSGRLRNAPRAAHGVQIPGGRAVSTALVFRRA